VAKTAEEPERKGPYRLHKADPLFDLTGRVALVTGAARGMGRAMAIAFAEHGADLLLADLNAQGLEETARAIQAYDRRAVPAVCDVSDTDQIDALLKQLDQEYGRIDVLANVAGEGVIGRPEDLPLDTVRKVFQNLVIGRFYLTQQVGRRMLAAGKGSILSIGSIASVTALGRGHVAYSMAMGAVVQMTRELSTEWSGRGVRVNAILPAQVMNPSLEARIRADPQLKDTFLRGVAMKRLGAPDDIRGLAVLLASDASAWITGAIIPMDGGNLAMNAGASHP
jgi:NAD(P)-dependent dehydrogenase (short-subunit alcohol dehydrogenase family)